VSPRAFAACFASATRALAFAAVAAKASLERTRQHQVSKRDGLAQQRPSATLRASPAAALAEAETKKKKKKRNGDGGRSKRCERGGEAWLMRTGAGHVETRRAPSPGGRWCAPVCH